jgi:ubiquinone biosynthesis protein
MRDVLAPEGEARRAAGRQMLEAYYQQVLADGFFHADPHPGNMMWAGEKVYLLDLGWWARWTASRATRCCSCCSPSGGRTSPFLAELMASLSAKPVDARFGEDALQQLTELSLRHGVRLPAALALIGKAFGQMQLAAAELDPTLDPFSVAGSFYMRQLGQRLRTSADPLQVFFEAQKLRVRADRVLESLERVIGARPGAGLQVEMTRNAELTAVIERTGKRIALGLTAAAAGVLGGVALGEVRRARR